MEEQLTEMYFIAPCPVDQCKNKNKFYRWTHNKCGGQLKLNIKGVLLPSYDGAAEMEHSSGPYEPDTGNTGVGRSKSASRFCP